ncbi:gluconate 2-dehydrogenase subunit 3 family protein [Salegentibacter chungangensis]|uniref:Gluconate 2-dehydrogenase subunit 3 family protein n=1 Tax=Salegentibacter chungangensis TaxID=1335724 RepID=A0ABW3NSC0_9FLAO
MNRRQALRNIGLGTGALVVGPTTLGLLQSCKNEPSYNWQPTFLSAANGFALQQILEVIIPKTDTPGAKDLNLAKFIDSYMDKVASKEKQNEFLETADAFSRAFQEEFDKEAGEGTAENYEQIVRKYLKANDKEIEVYKKRLTETQDPQDRDPKVLMDADAGAFSYLENVRGMGIWGWKTSEQIGENVLWYDPVPGEYIPCGPTSELGNGKTMSL